MNYYAPPVDPVPHVAAQYRDYGSTQSQVRFAPGWRLDRDSLVATGDPEYLSPGVDRALDSGFSRPRRELDALHRLATGYDGYGSEPPSAAVLYWAQEALQLAQDRSLPPRKVMAAAGGGAALCFLNGDRYGAVQFFNTGEIVAVTSGIGHPSIAWELVSSDLPEALERIDAFVRPVAT